MERRLNQPLISKRKIYDSAYEDEPLISKRSGFDWPTKRRRSSSASTRYSRSIGAREPQEELTVPDDGEDRQSEVQEEEGDEDQESEELEEDQHSDEEEEEEEEEEDQDQESEEEDEEDHQSEEEEEDDEDGHEGWYNEPSSAGYQQGHGSNIVVTLTEPSLLDCPICFEPLTIPVFQCDQNGHISCSSCCAKINNKCPSCSCPIGSNRCRAVEKFVESSTTPCQNTKYGCNTSVTYNKKFEHEKTCVYMLCLCPYFGCMFVSSAKGLYKNFSTYHVARVVFVLDDDFRSFSITLRKTDRFIVLEEKDDGMLFVVNNFVALPGNFVTLSCVQPSFMEGYNYYLVVKHKETTLKLRSVTESTPRLKKYSPPDSTSLLLIPHGFFDSNDHLLEMEICIWHK